MLLPDCFSNNSKEKSGIPVEGNNNNINYFSFTEERNSSVFRNKLVICKRVNEATNVRNLHTPENVEGREGVKWELGFAFFRGWEMGFCALHGTGIHEKKKNKNNRKMGMGLQFEQHRLGLWDLSWDLKKKQLPGKWY